MFLPQEVEESSAGQRQGDHGMWPYGQLAGRRVGGGAYADHLGCAIGEDGRRTGTLGRRFVHPVLAAGAGNRATSDATHDDVGDTAGATTAGDIAGIRTGDREPQVEDDEGLPDNEFVQPGGTRARTRAMTSAPPEVPPPAPGVMLPSSPPGIKDSQVEDDEAPPDNELLRPMRTRTRTRAYHQAIITVPPADHALFYQRPPNQTPALPTCDASQRLEPATYQDEKRLLYHAN